MHFTTATTDLFLGVSVHSPECFRGVAIPATPPLDPALLITDKRNHTHTVDQEICAAWVAKIKRAKVISCYTNRGNVAKN